MIELIQRFKKGFKKAFEPIHKEALCILLATFAAFCISVYSLLIGEIGSAIALLGPVFAGIYLLFSFRKILKARERKMNKQKLNRAERGEE